MEQAIKKKNLGTRKNSCFLFNKRARLRLSSHFFVHRGAISKWLDMVLLWFRITRFFMVLKVSEWLKYFLEK